MTFELAFGLIISNTLLYATPLLYSALGGTITENSGVINIGLEGMMTVGAFTGASIGFLTSNPWFGFLGAGIAGGLIALLHAIATITFNANHVVSGIAINFLGPGLSLFLSRRIFEGATQTPALSLDNKIPRPLNGIFEQNSFLDLLFNQYATVFIALLFVVAMWFLLYKTRLGLRLRAVGEHPEAADTLAINVRGIRYFAVISSGVLAGFGGATMSMAVTGQFSPALISGQGFIALAAMIFGRRKPQGALLACLLFGFAQGLRFFLDNPRIGLDFPSELLAMLPYVLTLIILIGFVRKSTDPKALGQPFRADS